MATFGKAKSNEIRLHSYNLLQIFLRQFKNPLLLIFVVSTVVAFILGQRVEALAIWAIMALSVFLGFWNEFRAEKTVSDLLKKIALTTTIVRNGVKEIVQVRDVRLGDVAVLFPGAIIPADIKIAKSFNLEVSEAVLTGESLPVVKEDGDFGYLGTVVVRGNGEGEVVAIGTDTKFGKISLDVAKVRPESEFQKGLRGFSLLLTKIAAVAVVVIIPVNLLLGRSFVQTILFALTIAMGITPELLPLIVTISLAYGAKKLAKKNVVVKQFVSIQDLGNMEILCTDKTGTLTEGNISLDSYQNSSGMKDDAILDLALICNSAVVHKEVFGDAIEKAIWEYARESNYQIKTKFEKIAESPFDYENRFAAVVIKSGSEKTLIIKGSPEPTLERCGLSGAEKTKLTNHFVAMEKIGLRVVCLATKKATSIDNGEIKKVSGLTFRGFVAFTDIPKKDVKDALALFKNLGVQLKILTGDSDLVAQKVCRDVGFSFKKILLGTDIDKLNDSELEGAARQTDIFARVSPTQKTRIVQALKKGGHTVGYLGDGVNDAPSLHDADIGISVNSAVDVAKDAASVVLIQKNLRAVADGIKEGRIIFNNTIKYVLMGTSSDFGNLVSVSLASLVLPFLPMMPVQVLLEDILYDISQLSIPTDNVDKEELLRPKNWDLGYIKRFMLFFGPLGSLYDLIAVGILFYVFQARGSFFQTAWFIETLITDIFVVFVIRSARVPFFKSKPSLALAATCLGVVALGLILPFSPLAVDLGFVKVPVQIIIFLVILTAGYLAFVEFGKWYLNRKAESSSRVPSH